MHTRRSRWTPPGEHCSPTWSPEKIRRQFDVNVLGLIATQAVLPHFSRPTGVALSSTSSVGGAEGVRIAEIIYTAVTDEPDRLRYEAGPDAMRMLAARRATEDGGLPAGMKTRFGLGGQQ